MDASWLKNFSLDEFINRLQKEAVAVQLATSNRQIDILEKALMLAIRESYTRLSPATHQKLFDYYIEKARKEVNL